MPAVLRTLWLRPASHSCSLDYQKYYDAIPSKAIAGAQNAQYAQFSLASLQAAQSKLSDLLALLPKDQLQLAQDQVAVGY